MEEEENIVIDTQIMNKLEENSNVKMEDNESTASEEEIY